MRIVIDINTLENKAEIISTMHEDVSRVILSNILRGKLKYEFAIGKERFLHEVWYPDNGDIYYTVFNESILQKVWCGDKSDQVNMKDKNVFQTIKEAEYSRRIDKC